MSKPAPGRIFGQELVDLWNLPKDRVEEIVIVVNANDVVKVEVTLICDTNETSGLARAFKRYVLVPEAELGITQEP